MHESILRKAFVLLGAVCFGGATSIHAANLTVDVTQTFQQIEGFGGGLAYYGGWLTAHPKRSAIYDTLFTGLGLSYLRIGNWDQDTTATLSDDSTNVAQAKLRLGSRVRLLLSSWSAPGPMKVSGQTSGSLNGAQLPPSQNTLLKTNGSYVYAPFAHWWKQSILKYRAKGMAPDDISMQNEPDMNAGYESTVFASTENDTLAGYAQAFQAVADSVHSLSGAPRVVGPEVLGIGWNNVTNFTSQMDLSRLDAVNFHLYHAGSYSNPEGFRGDIAAISPKVPGKPLIMTEYCDLSGSHNYDMLNAALIMQIMMTAGNVGGYIYWDLVWSGGGLVHLEYPWNPSGWVTSNGYTIDPEYHALRQFSKFTSRGWNRIAAVSSDTNIRTVAFTNPNQDSITVIVLNLSATSQTANVPITGYNLIDRWTSQTGGPYSQQQAVTASQTAFTLPDSSITTLVFTKAPSLVITTGASFRNPVLPGDHPDMNVWREGNDFYLTGSSFHMTPNVEILHSRDLVHWERVTGAVNPNWSGQSSSAGSGAWGGFLFKRNSTWFAYTAYNFGQQFMTAPSLTGPWTTPTPVNGAQGYDNSVFRDDDGKIYMVMKSGYGSGGFNGIQEIGADGNMTGSVINLSWINQDSATVGWAEGPTMVKHNGWYYYFTSTNTGCGGQEMAWRSRTLRGDQSSWEYLGVMLQGGTTAFGGPQHSTAPVQAPDGTWWILYHSYEYGEWAGLGRQGLLAPVTWQNDIPVVGTPVKFGTGPKVADGGIPLLGPKTGDFSGTTLGLQWQFFGKTAPSLYSLSARPGYLRLIPVDSFQVVQKAMYHAQTMTTQVNYAPTSTLQEAGLRYQNGLNNLAVKLSLTNHNGLCIRLSYNSTTQEIPWTADSAWLRMVRMDHRVSAYASLDQTTWTKVGTDLTVSALDNYGNDWNGWVGNFVGVYAQGATADFNEFSARDALDTLRAQDANALTNAQITTPGSSGPNYLGYLQNGSVVSYAGLDLGRDSTYARNLFFENSSGGTGGSVQVWEDHLDSGTLLATCPLPVNGAWESWQLTACGLSGSGLHDIHLRMVGGGGYLFNIRSFWFSSQGNSAPTGLALSNDSVSENQNIGTVVGVFSPKDPDLGNTFIYSLVSGTGSRNDSDFTVSGDTLKTAATFDYETKKSYSIRMRVTDQGGLYVEKIFTVYIKNMNEPPTAISLSEDTIAGTTAAHTVVGVFSTTDPDFGNTFTYSLVSGTGSTDSAKFAISGDSLLTSIILNSVFQNNYTIRVRSTDQGGLYYENSFTIFVTSPSSSSSAIGSSSSSSVVTTSVQFSYGSLNVSGVQGRMDIYNLHGDLVSSIVNANDGAYLLNLHSGLYIVRGAGLARTITVGIR